MAARGSRIEDGGSQLIAGSAPRSVLRRSERAALTEHQSRAIGQFILRDFGIACSDSGALRTQPQPPRRSGAKSRHVRVPTE